MFSTAFTYWTPEQIAARVGRYKDVIDRVEIENEVLIWGIPLDRPQYWSRILAEMRKAAPNVPPPSTYSVCCQRKGHSSSSGKSGRMSAVPLALPPGM